MLCGFLCDTHDNPNMNTIHFKEKIRIQYVTHASNHTNRPWVTQTGFAIIGAFPNLQSSSLDVRISVGGCWALGGTIQ